MPEQQQSNSEWLIIVPVRNLLISDAEPINGKWDVGRVTFYSHTALQNFLHQPNIHKELSVRVRSWVLCDRLKDGIKAFAATQQTGVPQEIRKEVFFELRQNVHILASTLAFYGKRSQNFGFNLYGYPMHTAKYDSFLDLNSGAYDGNRSRRGMLVPFKLDGNWYKYISTCKIDQLFPRINDPTLDDNWRRQIRSAAAMLGKSFMSLQLADAFLLDIIGLETLLTRPEERNGKMLAQRIKGLTGWHLRKENPRYESEITDMHKIRCAIVHDSDYSQLTTQDLLRADIYLMNSLLNIVLNPQRFPKKDSMITIVDDFAQNENWESDATIKLRWISKQIADSKDLNLPLW